MRRILPMTIIYKYPLEIQDSQIIQMPSQQIILDAAFQNMKLMLWAMVNPENKPEDVVIRIIGTGHEFQNNYGMLHIKTVHDNINGFVWHIFEDSR